MLSAARDLAIETKNTELREQLDQILWQDIEGGPGAERCGGPSGLGSSMDVQPERGRENPWSRLEPG